MSIAIEVKIEKGIPFSKRSKVPKIKPPKKGLRLALIQMAVGESFVIPSRNFDGLRSAAFMTGTRIRTELVGKGSFRVWKVGMK